MDLRFGKNAVFFKNTYCLSKKKCTTGHNIHDTLVYGHWDTLQNWCFLQFSWKCDGFESKYCSALIVLAEIASAKVLIFVLALAVALAIASATRNWDLYRTAALPVFAGLVDIERIKSHSTNARGSLCSIIMQLFSTQVLNMTMLRSMMDPSRSSTMAPPSQGPSPAPALAWSSGSTPVFIILQLDSLP